MLKTGYTRMLLLADEIKSGMFVAIRNAFDADLVACGLRISARFQQCVPALGRHGARRLSRDVPVESVLEPISLPGVTDIIENGPTGRRAIPAGLLSPHGHPHAHYSVMALFATRARS
jgi:hypothetical protein